MEACADQSLRSQPTAAVLGTASVPVGTEMLCSRRDKSCPLKQLHGLQLPCVLGAVSWCCCWARLGRNQPVFQLQHVTFLSSVSGKPTKQRPSCQAVCRRRSGCRQGWSSTVMSLGSSACC